MHSADKCGWEVWGWGVFFPRLVDSDKCFLCYWSALPKIAIVSYTADLNPHDSSGPPLVPCQITRRQWGVCCGGHSAGGSAKCVAGWIDLQTGGTVLFEGEWFSACGEKRFHIFQPIVPFELCLFHRAKHQQRQHKDTKSFIYWLIYVDWFSFSYKPYKKDNIKMYFWCENVFVCF